MWIRYALFTLRPATLLLAAVVFTAIAILAVDHPPQITVNGKSFRWPKSTVVVILIDGGDPAYVRDGLARNVLPNFRRLMTQGFASIAQGAMPSFTNPNNLRHGATVLDD